VISVATWNVNSVKSRLPHLLEWLKADKPDVVLLQETKCVDDAFPKMEIEELGYNLALHGEKSYNGVAILSKCPLDDIRRGVPGNESDSQARYIEAVVSVSGERWSVNGKTTQSSTIRHPPSTVMRVASVYVPNGQSPDSDKFQHKLQFLERLRDHFKTLLSYEEMLAVGGDYNIAPFDIDVHNPKYWANTVLCHSEVRQRLRSVLHMGIYDAHRICNPSDPGFSWWDYRAGAFDRDDGLRIDHLLLSPQSTDRLKRCCVKKDLRALEKASDHAPVVGQFAI
jgi:exodeoxyribonuclease III